MRRFDGKRGLVLGVANKPSYNVKIAAGSGDAIWIEGNTFADYATAPLSNGARGSQIFISGNSANAGAGSRTPLSDSSRQ